MWMTETPREIREKLIIQWYEKKLNRDELLRALEQNEILDKNIVKKLKSEILENFYENFEKAKEDEKYKKADAQYKNMKWTKKQIAISAKELAEKKKSAKIEIEKIDKQMLEIIETAANLENWSWLNKLKLKKINEKRDELNKQKKQINWEVFELYKGKLALIASLHEMKELYWPEIERPNVKWKNFDYSWKMREELENETTLLWYRKKYFQLIENKEKYVQKFLSEISDLDLWISKEKKTMVLELLKTSMMKELETQKLWDEITKFADETEKRLEDNWKTTMEQLINLKLKIKEIESQVKEIENKEKSATIEEVFMIKEKKYEVQKEIIDIKDKYNSIKNEIDEKLKHYNWTSIDWTKIIHLESRQERLEREKKEQAFKETKNLYKSELDTFASEEQNSWNVKYHKYPHGKWELSEKDRAAVKCWDKVMLILLFDCISNLDTTDSNSDPEQSTILCIKYWIQRVYITFVYRDANDPNKDDKSKAYRHIDLVDVIGDKVMIKLSSNTVQDLYTFILENGLLGKWVFEWHNKNLLDYLKSDTEYFEVPEDLKKRRDERIKNMEEVREGVIKRGRECECISDKHQEKIINEIDQIPIDVKIDSDWSRLIEFKLWDKIYKILDPKLDNHTDEEYRYIDYLTRKELRNLGDVKIVWMQWNNVDEWQNQKLKEYVKQKESEWLHIATKEEMKKLFEELWKYVNLWNEKNSIAAFMYLIWIEWHYFLSTWNGYSVICYAPGRREIYWPNDNSSGNLLMISCEQDKTV